MNARISSLATLVLSAGLSMASAEAQVPEVPDDFGTQDNGITLVTYADFTSEDGSNQSLRVSQLRWDLGGGWLVAPMNMLPNGALLTNARFYFRDSNDTENLSLYLCENYFDLADGPMSTLCRSAAYPGGAPGESFADFDVDLTIHYRWDRDGDGDTDIVHYTLQVKTPAADFTTAIRAVRLSWKRQVSPAPPAASFNDVPANDTAFQFIEALVASGITAGCGAGNYCPDAPLTRRQMAVFLAKALGLHWPSDAP
ncbi:MAG: S-layer homology domain-containing protein [Thermoanaerobaculia bacterium]